MAVELLWWWWWWPASAPWLTPGAAWFIFFNVVVGAIAVMSRGEQAGSAPTAGRRRLARTASTVVLERLRSISIFSSHHSAADCRAASSPSLPSPIYCFQDQQCFAFREQEAEEQPPASRVAPEDPGKPDSAPVAGECLATLPSCAPLPAAAAVQSEVEEAEAEPVTGEGGATAAAAATSPPSAPVAAPASGSEEEEVHDDEESISLDEAYALARARRGDHAQARWPSRASGAEAASTAKPRARACRRGVEEVEGKAEVNARAELFIRQFRHELKLQRLNSIINYTTELRRRAGAVEPRGIA